jgi:hypothetical protein
MVSYMKLRSQPDVIPLRFVILYYKEDDSRGEFT